VNQPIYAICFCYFGSQKETYPYTTIVKVKTKTRQQNTQNIVE